MMPNKLTSIEVTISAKTLESLLWKATKSRCHGISLPTINIERRLGNKMAGMESPNETQYRSSLLNVVVTRIEALKRVYHQISI